MGQSERRLPRVVGLCSDLSHAAEFYMPDPEPGESCPWCEHKLVHYARTRYLLEPPPKLTSRGQS